MAKPLQVTPELLNSVEQLAYTGLKQEEIAETIGRDRNTLFLNSKENHPELLSAYNKGKRKHKAKLLKEIEELGNDKENKRLQYDIKKYQLNVLHKTKEETKQEVSHSGAFTMYYDRLREKEKKLGDTKT